MSTNTASSNTNESGIMSALQPSETSTVVDGSKSVIKEPSVKLSDETTRVLFGKIPSSDGLVRAQALKELTSALQHQESHRPAWFESVLESFLYSTQAPQVSNGLAVLCAIWSISQDQALRFIQSEGFFARLAESVLKLSALDQSPPEDADLNKFFSEFLSHCLDHQSLCDTIQAEWPECSAWLTGIALATSPTPVSIAARCAATLALVRLLRSPALGSATPASSDELVDVVLIAFLGNKNPPSSAIKALALLSEEESAREKLRDESQDFFQTLKSLSQSTRDHEADQNNLTHSRSLSSELATIIVNLVSFKVIQNEIPADERENGYQATRAERVEASTWHYSWGTPLSLKEIEDEKHDRKLLAWLHSTLELNQDLIQTLAWLSKTDDPSPQLQNDITNGWLNLVEYRDCATLVFKSGGHRILMDIINTPKISDYLSRQYPPAATLTEPKEVTDPSRLVLDPHELGISLVLAKLIDNARCKEADLDENLKRSVTKLLNSVFLDPSLTDFQTYLALQAIHRVNRATPEVFGCSQFLDRLDQLMGTNLTLKALDTMDTLATAPAFCSRFASPPASDSNRTDVASITRLEGLLSLMRDKDVKLARGAAELFWTLTQTSLAVCQTIVTDRRLTDSLLKSFQKITSRDLDWDGYYISTSGSMCRAFQNIYDHLADTFADPPQLLVDHRLHYGLMEIDHWCKVAKEYGQFKDGASLQEKTASLSKCIIEKYRPRKKFKHYHIHNRKPWDDAEAEGDGDGDSEEDSIDEDGNENGREEDETDEGENDEDE